MNMARPPATKGWCPSALRPMETGDGFLVRLRFTGGDVSAGQCKAIGRLARIYGNGLIDLSQKGNLQLRGVKAEALPALTAALYEYGLLEQGAPSEAIRNVIAPPLAGIDATACIDGRTLARELETRLAAAHGLHQLPDKFCFLVDDGGCLGLDGVAADVRLTGFEGRVVIAVARGDAAAIPVAVTNASEAADAAMALADAFLRLCEKVSARRMDRLVQVVGAAEVARTAGFTSDAPMPSLPVRITEARDVIGLHAGFVGVGAPFGRLNADHIDLLASLAPGGVRLTPWRTILLPGAKPNVVDALGDAGLIVSSDDARLAIVACPGEPACASAQINTRRAAESLAPIARAWAPKGVTMHISGCSKGCASSAPVPLTLVGRDGAYDLIFNGRADAAPAQSGLDLPQLFAAIRESHAGKVSA